MIIFIQCSAFLSSEFSPSIDEQNDVIKYENIVRNNLLPGWKIKNCGILDVLAILEVTRKNDINVFDSEIGNRLLRIDISFREKISQDSILAKREKKESLIAKEKQISNKLWGPDFKPISPFTQYKLDGRNDSAINQYNSIAEELIINENNFPNHYTDQYSVYFDILDSAKIKFPNEEIKRQYYANAKIITELFKTY
jgi:hypothetical protein